MALFLCTSSTRVFIQNCNQYSPHSTLTRRISYRQRISYLHYSRLSDERLSLLEEDVSGIRNELKIDKYVLLAQLVGGGLTTIVGWAKMEAMDARWTASMAAADEGWDTEMTAADERWKTEMVAADERWKTEMAEAETRWTTAMKAMKEDTDRKLNLSMFIALLAVVFRVIVFFK